MVQEQPTHTHSLCKSMSLLFPFQLQQDGAGTAPTHTHFAISMSLLSPFQLQQDGLLRRRRRQRAHRHGGQSDVPAGGAGRGPRWAVDAPLSSVLHMAKSVFLRGSCSFSGPQASCESAVRSCCVKCWTRGAMRSAGRMTGSLGALSRCNTRFLPLSFTGCRRERWRAALV